MKRIWFKKILSLLLLLLILVPQIGVSAGPSVSSSISSSRKVINPGQSVSLSASARARDCKIGFFGVYGDGEGWLVYRNNVGGMSTSWSGLWHPPRRPGTYTAYVSVTGVDDKGRVVCSDKSLVSVRVNAPPSVSLIAEPEVVYEGDYVSIQVHSEDSDGSITELTVKIGDETLYQGPEPNWSGSWCTSSPGNYTIVAMARDNNGACSSTSKLVQVKKKEEQTPSPIPSSTPSPTPSPPSSSSTTSEPSSGEEKNQPPLLYMEVRPREVYLGEEVEISVLANDSDGFVVRLIVQAGEEVLYDGPASKWNGSWFPSSPGAYEIVSRALDDSGNWTNKFFLVRVKSEGLGENSDPSIEIWLNSTQVVVGQSIEIIVRVLDPDPGQNLFINVTGAVEEFFIAESGQLVERSYVVMPGPGNHSILVRVDDGSGGISEARASFSVLQRNHDPFVEITVNLSKGKAVIGDVILVEVRSWDPDPDQIVFVEILGEISASFCFNSSEGNVTRRYLIVAVEEGNKSIKAVARDKRNGTSSAQVQFAVYKKAWWKRFLEWIDPWPETKLEEVIMKVRECISLGYSAKEMKKTLTEFLDGDFEFEDIVLDIDGLRKEMVGKLL